MPTPSPVVPGYRLDRYEVLCPIAQGGMAQVWLARLRAKHGFEKLVALKTILPQYAADEKFQQMFLDEARIAARIDHVNVAHVIDLGDERGVLYLVMEWVDGDSLVRLQASVTAKGERVPTPIALRIIADTCAALDTAHDLRDHDGQLLNVVHRDISPQNVLVSTDGIAKVIDFGIAKARDRLAGESSTGSIKGKIQFMAPEQAVGRPVDRRADIRAAGALLYYLLAGKPPYDGENQFQTLHRIASGEAPPALPKEIPASVSALVMRALAFDPDARFATAAEMQRALEAIMREERLVATNSDVAEFVGHHLGERAFARRGVVEQALKAARVREAASPDSLGAAPSTMISPGASSMPLISPMPQPELPTMHGAMIASARPLAMKRRSAMVAIVATVAVATAISLIVVVSLVSFRSAHDGGPSAGASLARPSAAVSSSASTPPAIVAATSSVAASTSSTGGVPMTSASASASAARAPDGGKPPRPARPAARPAPRPGEIDDGF